MFFSLLNLVSALVFLSQMPSPGHSEEMHSEQVIVFSQGHTKSTLSSGSSRSLLIRDNIFDRFGSDSINIDIAFVDTIRIETDANIFFDKSISKASLSLMVYGNIYIHSEQFFVDRLMIEIYGDASIEMIGNCSVFYLDIYGLAKINLRGNYEEFVFINN